MIEKIKSSILNGLTEFYVHFTIFTKMVGSVPQILNKLLRVIKNDFFKYTDTEKKKISINKKVGLKFSNEFYLPKK